MNSTSVSAARLIAHAGRSASRLRNRHYRPLRMPQGGLRRQYHAPGRAVR